MKFGCEPGTAETRPAHVRGERQLPGQENARMPHAHLARVLQLKAFHFSTNTIPPPPLKSLWLSPLLSASSAPAGFDGGSSRQRLLNLALCFLPSALLLPMLHLPCWRLAPLLHRVRVLVPRVSVPEAEEAGFWS